MAQKVQVILIDDVDGGEATETVRFALDRSSYEIDLSSKHAKELRDSLRQWVSSARRVSADKPVGRRRGAATTTARKETAEIRDWARSNGYEVGDRGRIPTEVVDAFRAAKGS
ncbi:Lsr2 family protein [Saxibacter everestensis]|uniref:Lsr2 family protein n=1 Tax=Saxibacter everestensis TaxID=2909229 RepID=A0ABY8QRE8_9MICO|nr:Lsr2 family protein [Brevibacteriaceae bacterium ZFBP1038]